MGDYGTSGAVEGASNAGSAVDTASLYSNMANVGDTASTASSGAGAYGGFDATQQATQGPMESTGWQSIGDWLEKFDKGRGNSLGQAWKERGFNPQTYGYAAGKLQGMMGSGQGAGTPQPIVNNISYQQPENDYLRRYRRV